MSKRYLKFTQAKYEYATVNYGNIIASLESNARISQEKAGDSNAAEKARIIVELEAELSTLKEQVTLELKTKSNEIGDVRDLNRMKTKEIETLRASVKSRDEEMAAFAEKESQYVDRVSRLILEAEYTSKRYESLVADQEIGQQTLQMVVNERNTLLEEISALKSHIPEVKDAVISSESAAQTMDIEPSTDFKLELEAKIVALESARAGLMASLEESMNEASNLKAQLETLSETLQQANQVHIDSLVEKHSASEFEFQDILEKQRLINENLNDTLYSMTNELTQIRVQYEQAMNSDKEKSALIESRNIQMQTLTDAAKAAIEEIDGLKLTIVNSDILISELVAKVAELGDASTAKENASKKALEDLHKSMLEARHDLEKMTAQNSNLKEECMAINERFESVLRESERAKSELRAKCVDAEQQITGIKKKAEMTQHDLENSQNMLRDVQLELQATETTHSSKMADLELSRQQIDAEKSQIEIELSKLTNEMPRLKQSLTKLQSDNAELLSQNADFAKMHDQVKSHRSQMEKEIIRLRQQVLTPLHGISPSGSPQNKENTAGPGPAKPVVTVPAAARKNVSETRTKEKRKLESIIESPSTELLT